MKKRILPKVLFEHVSLLPEGRWGIKALFLIAIPWALILWCPTGAWTQAHVAAVRGTVLDVAGAPIAGIKITARNLETGRNYTAHSNTQGSFEISPLLPGRYELKASGTNFISETRDGLGIRAGEIASLLFALEPTPTSQKQNATEERGEAESSGAARSSSPNVSQQISESQLVGLPLNGRSFSQLATLQSEISDPFAGSATRGGGSGGLTVSGGRSTSNNFLLDGTNIMDSANQIPRSAAGVQLGADAILQVQVFSTNYGAEYGRNTGGVLNSITRSGTSELHGTIFEYFRNSKLDARNFFDPGPEPTPFKRNQFGFTLTGPVVKDRTFFMGSFEGLRDRLTTTDVSFFPDGQARQGIITDREGRFLRKVEVHPNVKPYLDLYPLPNSDRIGGGIGENRASQFLPTDENFLTIRLDHKISDQDSLFGRYTLDEATSHLDLETFLFKTIKSSRQQYLTLAATHLFSPSRLNSFRLGITRPVDSSETISVLKISPSLYFVRGAPGIGQINVPGLSPFGSGNPGVQGSSMTSIQFADDFITQKGNHALKLGFDIHRYRWNLSSTFWFGGVWSFNSLESFLRGGKEPPPEGEENAREENARTDPSEGTTILSVALPGSDPQQYRRQTLLGFYIQDAYKMTSRFQFNLGLRYEFATLIRELNNKLAFLPDPVHDTELQVGRLIENNPSLWNLAPRLGITWSPWSNRSTVISGGFGIYYDQMLGWTIINRRAAAPFNKNVTRTNFDSSTTFPDAVSAAAGIPIQVHVLDYYHFTNPIVLRYNLTIQEQLLGGWRVQASYVGVRGNHLHRSYEANLFPVPIIRSDGSLYFPPNTRPLNPVFLGINVISSDAQSFYNSLQMAANKSFGQGISVQASYTYSKSVDDSSAIRGSSYPDSTNQYGLMRTLDRGLSDFDIRHRLVINYFYTPPFGIGQRWWNSGVLGHIFGNWRLGGILSFRAGIPFTPQVNIRTPRYLFVPSRPNLSSGGTKNPTEGITAGCEGIKAGQKLGTRDLYFDPCTYEVPLPGTLGSAGRNTIIAPSVFNLDVSLQKEFLLDAKRRLQFRAEFFNLPNHTNFNQNLGGSVIVFSGASGRRNPTAGRIGSTATTARQIQFALRLSF